MGKQKGSSLERELVHLFYDAGWAPVRVAGSGSAQIPAVDIVVGKGGRVFAIECKGSRDAKIYIAKDQIRELALFATTFGAEPLVGVRFDREEWRFLTLGQLQETEKHFVVDRTAALSKGKSFQWVLEHPPQK